MRSAPSETITAYFDNLFSLPLVGKGRTDRVVTVSGLGEKDVSSLSSFFSLAALSCSARVGNWKSAAAWDEVSTGIERERIQRSNDIGFLEYRVGFRDSGCKSGGIISELRAFRAGGNSAFRKILVFVIDRY